MISRFLLFTRLISFSSSLLNFDMIDFRSGSGRDPLSDLYVDLSLFFFFLERCFLHPPLQVGFRKPFSPAASRSSFKLGHESHREIGTPMTFCFLFFFSLEKY